MSPLIRIFRDDITDDDRFVVTLELVPGSESLGRSVDTVMAIAADAYADGRVSAVSITDNPGGNPSLSPDALGYEIFKLGMDVIVHFTCRDLNRVGMESRALQLAMMGIKNILALSGDYSGQGFGGQGAPVFDLDSVNLTCMLAMLNDRLEASGDPEGFFTGCAVSPFKATEAETFTQYAKLCKKVSAGARFVITQLGYDVRKFQELLQMQQRLGIKIPTLASLYLLTPLTARIMNQGRIPGAVVTDRLREMVVSEWQNQSRGRNAAIERSARLAAVLKGIGYRGIHIGGIHKSFAPAGRILDRLEQIQDRWQEFLPAFDLPQPRGFYVFRNNSQTGLSGSQLNPVGSRSTAIDRIRYELLRGFHHLFFNFDSPLANLLARGSRWLDRRRWGRLLAHLLEAPIKFILLACQQCGDCGIAHVAFLCPESQCPKHCRNGPCGGSFKGRCEVRTERDCVWYRAYQRMASAKNTGELMAACVPPRMWELNHTCSWLNFHLRRDHQSASSDIVRFCSAVTCKLPGDDTR